MGASPPNADGGGRLETDGDGVFAEKIGEFGIRLAIGDHPVELGQGADAGRLGFAELAVIGHQDLLLRHRHRAVLHLQLVEVKAGGAVLEAEAGGGDKGDVRADVIQLVVLADAGKDIVVRLEFPAAQDDLAVGFVLQRQKGVQRVADRGKWQTAVKDSSSAMASMIAGVVVPQSKNTVSFSLINGAASRPMRRFSVTCLAFWSETK